MTDSASERLDADLSPSRTAKDAAGTVAGWARDTAAARERWATPTTLGLPYGPHPRQRLDVYGASESGADRPLLVFLHGGFWQEGSLDVAGSAAAPLVAAGWLVVAVGYRLAPEVTLSEVCADAALGVRTARVRGAEWGGGDRWVLAGHSAGAHLGAMAVLGDDVPGAPPTLLGLGGVFDLAPIAESYVDDAVGMTPAEIRDLSPILHAPPTGVRVVLVVGADETAEFLRQSRALASAWSEAAVELVELPGRDHFDLVDAALAPDAPWLAGS